MIMDKQITQILLHKLNNKACAIIGRIDIIEPINDLQPDLKSTLETIKKNLNDIHSIILELNKQFYD